MKTNNVRQKLIRSTSLIIIIVLAITTLGLSTAAQRWLSGRSQDAFDRDTRVLAGVLTERMSNYADLLYSGRAFITNTDHITQAEWERFYNDQTVFKRYPGVSSVSYVEDVTPAELPGFLQKMRARPEFGGARFGVKPPGERQSYALASLTVSQNDISSGYGFDMYSDPVRKQTLLASQQSGQPQASPPVTFPSGDLGFSLVLPVYEQRLLSGYVVLGFRTNQLMGALIKKDDPRVPVKISDVSSKDPVPLLVSDTWVPNAAMSRTDHIKVGGRTWEIAFAAERLYGESQAHAYLPNAILVRGFVVTLLLLGIFGLLIKPLMPED